MKTIQNTVHQRNQLEMTTLKTLLKIWYGVVSSEHYKTSFILQKEFKQYGLSEKLNHLLVQSIPEDTNY